MDTNTLYAILGIGAMVMVTVGIIFLSRLKASISTKGVEIDGSKAQKINDQISIKTVKGGNVVVTNRKQQDIRIKDISEKADIQAK